MGGVVFLALVALGVWLFLRHKRRNETPPSASYAGETNEKSHSFFGFGSTKDKNEDHLVAEPWVGGSTTAGTHSAENGVSVQPWTPAAPGDQAFLSPAGTATTFNGSTPSPAPQHQYPMSPGSPGFTGTTYDRPSMGSGGYSPVPAGGHAPQAMWVERS